MEVWLQVVTKHAIVVINAMALVIIVIGTIEAFVRGLGALLRSSTSDHDHRTVWIRYGRWLVAGLTFQLAADIIETSITPSWEDIGRLAAVALIRTFLNFVLNRELAEMRDRPEPAAGPTARPE